MKIDIHAHIMPENYPDLKKMFGYGGWIYLEHHKPGYARMMRDDGRFFREIGQNCWDPEFIIQDMDKHSVTKMVLCTIPVLFSYWSEPKHGLEWSAFLNDHLSSVVKNNPERFFGLGTVPLQDPKLACLEAERCVSKLGLKGLEIGTNVNQINLNDPVFYPFYECCEALNIPLLVHPWEMMGEANMQKYWLPWLVGMPAECSRAISSMIFGGIFDKFPSLKVMFCHGGGSFPLTLGRIDHGYFARPDLCATDINKPPFSYLGKFYVDGITHDPQALRYLISVFGSDRIAYGTDYPFPLGDLEHGKFIEEMQDLDTKTKENLFYKTAQDFLSI